MLNTLKAFGTWVVVSMMVVPPQAYAAANAENQAALKSLYQDLRDKGPKVTDYVNSMKGELSPEMFKFLWDKAEGAGGTTLALKLERNALVLEVAGARVPFSIVNLENGVFSVNNKTVTITDKNTPQEVWDKILSTMPKSSAGLIRFLIPEAYGFGPLVVLGIVVVAGALAAIAVNRFKCSRWDRALDSCNLAKTNFRNDSDLLNASPLLFSNLQNAYSVLKHNTAGSCGGRRERAQACVTELENQMKTSRPGEAAGSGTYFIRRVQNSLQPANSNTSSGSGNNR
jgi:hypothetical protein